MPALTQLYNFWPAASTRQVFLQIFEGSGAGQGCRLFVAGGAGAGEGMARALVGAERHQDSAAAGALS